MNAKRYIEKVGKDEAARIAKEAGTSFAYLMQIAYGNRNASVGLADRLIAASGGKLDLMSLIRSTPDRKKSA